MIIQLLLFTIFALVLDAKKSYEGYKVIEVNVKTEALVNFILKLSEDYQADIWKGPSKVDSTHIMLSPSSFTSFVTAIGNMGIHYSIINDNVQSIIDKEERSNSLSVLTSKIGLKAFSISDHYQSYDEIISWLDRLVKSNNITSVGSIGTSYEGRKIKFIKFSTGRGRKAVLMDGGIHAREWLAISTVNYIIDQILSNYKEKNRAIMNLLDKYDLYFIPVLNPDGYEYSHTPGNRLWRKNRKPYGRCDGVDLNRNFDAAFGGARTSSNPCAETFRGPYAFSEPESRALSTFIAGLGSNLHFYMSLHSYAQFWFVPYAYTDVPSSDDWEMRRVANIGNEALYYANGVRFKVGTPSELLYTAAGGSYDWVKMKAGVKYSYTLEVRPRWGSSFDGLGFIAPISDIVKSGKEIFVGFIASLEATKN